MVALVAGLALAAWMPAIAAAAGPSSVPRSTWVPNGPVNAVEVVGDRAYIAGDFSRVGPYRGSFPRIHRTTGEAQQGWPEVVGSVSAVESDGAGGWFIGGAFVAVGGVPRAGLAHVLPGGSVDPAFAPAVSGGGVKALLRIGATLYVGGDFTAINGEARSRLGAVDAATGALTSFAPAMNNEVRALAGRRFASTTTIWAGGVFSAVGGSSRSAVAGFTNGELNSYAPVINGYVEALELDGLTGMYIGGHFTTVNGAGRTGVARVTGETGTTTSPFAADVGGAGGDTFGPVVNDIERTSGSVYLAGDFERVNSGSRPNLAAVDPVTGALTSWTPAVAPAAPNTQLSDVLVDPAVPDTVFAGGFGFGVRAYNATTGARSTWAPLDPRATIVEAVAVDGNAVVVGGVIDVVGGVARNRFAELDLVTGRATALDVGLNQPVFDMARRGTTLYLAGAFSRTEGPGGGPRPGAASFDTAQGRWTHFMDAAGANDVIAVVGNTVWTARTSDLQGYRDDVPGSGSHVPLAEPLVVGPDINALTGTDDTLYLGGDFTHLVEPDGTGTHLRANLAAIRPDGEILPWNPGANDEVTAIAPAGSTVLAGGEFTTAGGAARTALAGLDATTGTATPFVSGDSATPTALGPLDGELLVARESDPLLSALDSLTGVPGSWRPGAHTSLRTLPAEDILVSRERGVLVGGGMAVGLGPVRTVNLAIFPLSPPPPTRVAATAGDGRATVSFTTPGDGGSPITGYRVTASPGGATATGGSSPIVVSGLQNGTEYTFTVTATNAVGTSPPSKPSAPIAPAVAPVAPAGPAPPGAESPPSGAESPSSIGGGAAAGTADRTPPLLRSFSARPKRFAGRAGTRLRVRLSEPARVRFELLARSRGRRVGRRCRPQTRANRRRRPCTRLVRRAQLVRRVGAAPPAVRFRAARVRPGRYILRATPTDAAGNVGRARSIAVVVLRSRSRR